MPAINKYLVGFNNIQPVSSATDILAIVGSSSKTVRIHKVTLSGTRDDVTSSVINFYVRSTANSGGSPVSLGILELDSLDPSATALAHVYVTNPTLGTLNHVFRVNWTAGPSTPSGNDDPVPTVPLVVEFKNPVLLRGTAELFTVNLAGITHAGAVYGVLVEFTED